MTKIFGRKLSVAVSLLATVGCGVGLGAPAQAQNSQPAPAPAGGQAADNTTNQSALGGEIVVTAERRSESLMQVPTSIVAVTGEQLQSNGIKQITDLQFTTPGYNVADSNGYTQVFIRGIGNSIFVGADPSVATFIDDVPRIYGSMVNNFVDVERVEVLKGAQGGLYGRNATGGVVNIITRQPSTDAFSADMRLDYGERNTFEAAAYVNVPVSDSVAFSLSGERRTHDPYIKNIAPSAPYSAAYFPVNNVAGPGTASYLGTPAQTAAALNAGVYNPGVDNENFYAVDGKLLIKPANNFKVTIAGDYSNKNDTSGNSLYTQNPAIVQATLGGYLGLFTGASPNLPNGFVIGNTPKFTVAAGNPGYVKLEDYGVSGTAVLNLPGVDITSITAYRYQHTQFIDDLAASSVPVFDADVNNRKHFFYEEVRGISTFAGPLHLIGGATYLQSHYNGFTNLDFLISPLSAAATTLPFLLNIPLTHAFDEIKNWSVYGQAEYDLTQQLTATASGRFVHESNSALFPGDTTGTPPSSYAASQQKFLPSATLSYKLDGGGNVYLRYARGFKAGGINPVAPPSSFQGFLNQGSVFKGETVDTFEGGIHVPLDDHKISATAAVFYNNYTNLQLNAHVAAAYAANIIEAIINAGSARTYGVEGSLNWHVSPPLTLGVTAGYLNAKFKNFGVGVTNPQIVQPFDLNGTQMPNAPKFQLALTANIDQPISDSLRVVGDVLASRTSSVLLSESGQPNPALPGQLPNVVGPAYWLVNARLGIRTKDDKYGLAVYADNLFNSAYYTYGSSSSATGNQINWGNPRVIGMEATAKF